MDPLDPLSWVLATISSEVQPEGLSTYRWARATFFQAKTWGRLFCNLLEVEESFVGDTG